MKIALTGTPGVGKTTVSKKLAERGYDILRLTDYFEEKDIGENVNNEREVRIGEMIENLNSEELEENTVIEGHLSHHYPVDVCVVLRCRPGLLKERLSKRSYPDRKIEENIEAEKLDIILSEAVQKQQTVIEIDTTNNSVEETVEELIDKTDKGKNNYGNIDWLSFS